MIDPIKLVALILGTISLAFIWYATNWLMALGVFIALFAINMNHSAQNLSR